MLFTTYCCVLLSDPWLVTGLHTFVSGDGRTRQTVPRNPMQATQARAVKSLSSVPEHVFHNNVAWLNMSMAGVSHEFFEGLAEVDRAQTEKLASSELLNIASQFVTRPYTEDELKEVLRDAAKAALTLRTGRQPDPDRMVKIPQAFFPNESVTVAATEAATGCKLQASAETRKAIDADLDVHRKLACPARAAYVLLRDSQEKQMDALREHFSLCAAGHAGTISSADALVILDFCDQCSRDADSMMAQIFLLPAANLSNRIMRPVAVSPKKSKFGTAVPPSPSLAESSSLRMAPVSSRPAGIAGRWGSNTAPKLDKPGLSGAAKTPSAVSPSQRKNRNRRVQAKAVKAAAAQRAATPAATRADTPAAAPASAGRPAAGDKPQQATKFTTPRQGPHSGDRGGGGSGRGSSRGRGRGSPRGGGRGRGNVGRSN